MKFLLCRASALCSSEENPNINGAILCPDGKYRIDLNSLEDIMNIIFQTNKGVIIQPPDDEFHPEEYEITIYDDYIE